MAALLCLILAVHFTRFRLSYRLCHFRLSRGDAGKPVVVAVYAAQSK